MKYRDGGSMFNPKQMGENKSFYYLARRTDMVKVYEQSEKTRRKTL